MKNLYNAQTIDLFDGEEEEYIPRIDDCIYDPASVMYPSKEVLTYVNGEWVDARTLTM